MTKPFENTIDDKYPVVGRDSRINLHRYMVAVHGRNIIDYEKIRREDFELYKSILEREKQFDKDEELKHTRNHS